MTNYDEVKLNGKTYLTLNDAGFARVEELGLDWDTDPYGCDYAKDDAGAVVDLDMVEAQLPSPPSVVTK